MSKGKKRIVIVGGGFAGLAAAKRLRRYHSRFEITLLDKRQTSDFLPLVPDVISGKVGESRTRYSLTSFASENGCDFVCTKAEDIDAARQVVKTHTGAFPYDYLVLACGTQTTFFNREEISSKAYVLDSTADAVKLREEAAKGDFRTAVVVGGGYTGVETATHLRRLFKRQKENKRIVIVELGSQILSQVPAGFRAYTLANLKNMSIEVKTQTTVQDMEGGTVMLTDGTTIEEAVLVWEPGVAAPKLADTLGVEQGAQRRVKVDPYLQASQRCFVAGDSALPMDETNVPLRLSVQFALQEGACAADNIVRREEQRPLRALRPLDLGYVIPMANNRSAGKALGIPVYGVAATSLHYFMCMLRAQGSETRWGVFRDLCSHR